MNSTLGSVVPLAMCRYEDTVWASYFRSTIALGRWSWDCRSRWRQHCDQVLEKINFVRICKTYIELLDPWQNKSLFWNTEELETDCDKTVLNQAVVQTCQKCRWLDKVYDRYLVGLKTIFLQFIQGRNKLEIKRKGIRYLHLLLAILHLAALGDAVISFSLSLHLLHAHILAHIVTKRSWALPRRLFQIRIDSLGDSCSVFWNSQIILIFVCLLLSLLMWGKGSLFKGKRETNNTSKWFS